MKMKQQLWNLHFGNKAFVFTLDAALAFVIVILILGMAAYYVNIGHGDISKAQLFRTGSDILALLDHSNTLDTLNQAIISNASLEMLPVNYEMQINITTKNGVKLSIGNALPENKFIASGKRVFVVSDEETITDYGLVQYWIWLK